MENKDPIAEAKRLRLRANEKRWRERNRDKVLARRARFRERNRERLRREGTEYNRRIGKQPRKPPKPKPPKREKIICDPRVTNLVALARSRAREKGLPFDLKSELLSIPDTCPVLGMPLMKTPGRCTPETPSLDRIVPALGYVQSNVRIISHRANTLKSNGTLEEFRAIVRDLENLPPIA